MSPRLGLPPLWTVSQRRVVLGIVVGLTVYLLIQFWRNPVQVSDPPPEEGARSVELADRVDPNIADAAVLAVVPTLGEKRANEIVAYRERFVQLNPGERAFLEPRDLLKVKGIGVSMVANLEPYLLFPARSDQAQPGR